MSDLVNPRHIQPVLTILIAAIALFCQGCKTSELVNDKEALRWAEKTLQSMPLDKRVAQLVCSDISGVYLPEDDPKFQSWLTLAGEVGIGGFVIYGGTPRDIALLLNRLQKESEIPLLISADFEGGPGQQVTGASEFPPNMAFAAIGDEDLMYRSAKIMAEEGRAMGIHLTYTPVTDVSLYPDNPQESVRSFGGDIDLNGRMLTAYIKGYHEIGMLTTAKHFPGRGDMHAMIEYPLFNQLTRTAEDIRAHEFKAFRYAIDAGVDFMMTEHIAVPSICDGSMMPASVEPELATGVVREELGFKGILTTDDLWYDHVVERFGAEEVAVMAIEAGHDIVLKPKNPEASVQAIVAAVQTGRISEQRINESVMKILLAKSRLNLQNNRMVDPDQLQQKVGTLAHQQVIQEVADRSVVLMKNDGLLPLKDWDPAKTVHIIIQKDEIQPFAADLAVKMSSAFPALTTFTLKPSACESYLQDIGTASRNADLIILSFLVQRTRHGDATPIRDKDMNLIQKIIKEKPDSVLAMSFGNPYLIRKMENIPAFMVGWGEGGWYGNQPVYFDSFIKILKGELMPEGRVPVTCDQ